MQQSRGGECSIVLNKTALQFDVEVENVFPLKSRNLTSDAHQFSRLEMNLFSPLNLIEYPLSI